MEKIHKAQVFKTVVLFAFLLMIPFISSSLRTSYLYFILNLLILVLAIESGVLTAASDPADEKKQALLHPYVASPLLPNYYNLNSSTVSSKGSNGNECNTTGFPLLEKKKKKPTMAVAEKPTTATKALGMAATTGKKTIKRSPSRPSLFFIGGFEDEEEEIIAQADARSVLKVEELKKKKVEEEEDEFFFDDEDDDDELFARAELFIGNFYKQLKIQREESWKRIHGIYQKAL